VQYVTLHVLSSELCYSFCIGQHACTVHLQTNNEKATFNNTPQYGLLYYLYRQDKVVRHIGRSRKHMVQDQIIQSRL
jgi:hypothetical protein